MSSLISPKSLHQNFNNPDLIVLDVSPTATINGQRDDVSQQTIPGARYVNIKKSFVNADGEFPNTVPSSAQFEMECQRLGINSTSHIVVFDDLGIYTSPRMWWLFKWMGHENVAVLDGGLPAWMAEGFEVVDRKEEQYELGNFKSNLQPGLVKTYDDVLENVSSPSFQVIDARSAGRFNGTAPEPRKHLKSGHIPNSANLPYQEVLEDGIMKSAEALQQLFDEKCDDSKELVFSCGSGLTACIIMLAAEQTDHKSKWLFDGSWTEWAERQQLIEPEE